MKWKLFTAMTLLLGSVAVSSCDSGKSEGSCNPGREKVNGECVCINDSNYNGVCDEDEPQEFDVFQEVKGYDTVQPQTDILVEEDILGQDYVQEVGSLDSEIDTNNCPGSCNPGEKYCQTETIVAECVVNEYGCGEWQDDPCGPKKCEEGECVDCRPCDQSDAYCETDTSGKVCKMSDFAAWCTEWKDFSCDIGYSCLDGKCLENCIPDCDDKECGSDSCGDSCGDCGPNEDCNSGTCYGPGQMFDYCSNDTDCLSEICADGFNGDGFCTKSCFSDCFYEGLVCDSGSCELPPTNYMGWPCSTNQECGSPNNSTAFCLEDTICTITCDPDLGCPENYICTGEFMDDSFCLP